MVRLAAALFIGIMLLAGCAGPGTPAPEARVDVSNAAYTVERLFTDGAGNVVYRFRDRGDYHYYVAGSRGAQMVPPPARPAAGTTVPEAN